MGDNENLCAVEPCLQLRRFHLEGVGGGVGAFRSARSVGQSLTL